MGQFVILSGPSCVGKSPLVKALKRLQPEMASQYQPLVLYNDRTPRPGEKDGEDYHFRTRSEIEKLRDRDGFTVMEVRGDLQAIDHNALHTMLQDGNVLYEGNPFVGAELLNIQPDDTVSMFMAPLSREELTELKTIGEDVPDLVCDVMRRKLLRRTRHQNDIPSLKDLEDVERRAQSAYPELQFAHRFDGVIVTHDGEDSEHWDAFYHPVGDARNALRAFVRILEGTTPDGLETWNEGLLP